MTDLTIRNDEQVIFALRSLYEKYGYSQYKMTKFEEYDLYVRNKDFLISDNIITFNDTNGKLMALKPDVTLSIIKNNKNNTAPVRKVYYNENVYRVSKGSNSFKEIMQVGLECLGDIDDYNLSEVLSLAAESLISISDECILSVSNIDFIANILDAEDVSSDIKSAVFKFIGEKNLHELSVLLKEAEISEENAKKLCALATLHGNPDRVLPKLRELFPDNDEVNKFESILNSLSDEFEDIIEIDFSITGDSKYYNGIAFKGYISGISGSVLSGGQYDRLMRKMRQSDKAIGFAIYMDMLESLNEKFNDYDVDTVLLYSDGDDIAKLTKALRELADKCASIIALKKIPQKFRYRALMKFDGEEAKLCE